MMHGHMHHPAPMHHHHHHGSVWGRGGSNFWPGFIGGVVGGAIVNSRPVYTPAPVVVAPSPVVVAPTPVVTPAPVVVTPTPVVTPSVSVQNVWVEGAYVDQVQGNGTIMRVWQPGHYEQRQVTY